MARCQRIGCDAYFSADENPEDSCCYHPGPPLFHDGAKEWSCCKQRSHDFSLFLSIPGCATGKHTSEKPQTKAAPSPNQPVQVTATRNPALDAAKAACNRCRQGFFCADHGVKLTAAAVHPPLAAATQEPTLKPVPPPNKATRPKVFDLDAQQVCKHRGCGNTFTERENHGTACHYHRGPAVFHDRLRGWGCCDVHVKDFDEFLAIPPCAHGWHNASREDGEHTDD